MKFEEVNCEKTKLIKYALRYICENACVIWSFPQAHKKMAEHGRR